MIEDLSESTWIENRRVATPVDHSLPQKLNVFNQRIRAATVDLVNLTF
jgi:hypothetical protein